MKVLYSKGELKRIRCLEGCKHLHIYGGLENEQSSKRTVSYTHLDVYKRQMQAETVRETAIIIPTAIRDRTDRSTATTADRNRISSLRRATETDLQLRDLCFH